MVELPETATIKILHNIELEFFQQELTALGNCQIFAPGSDDAIQALEQSTSNKPASAKIHKSRL